uniref:Uncharacterized protein n=1 Tax=Rhizophagus irregularis (strain DAOM 181602 / DAOM 197198 / MUCL 43194) TaxID=747089 RepID=U9UHY4_RHIID
MDWTSGNDNIDKFIQDTQLSACDVKEALEWIPYSKLYDIKYIAKGGFGENQNLSVILENLNYSNNITSEFMKKINKAFGITQDPETKSYMMVLHCNKCKMCKKICYAIRFQQNFKNWTSGNDNIDKFIQDTQLSAHDIAKEALEWIPYNRFYNIKYISKDEFGEVYRAKWSDGNIGSIYSWKSNCWDDKNQNWERNNLNMFVNLKSLNSPNDLTFELAIKIKIEYEFYGITQDPETKNYMMVLNNKCKKCNKICNAIHFQHKFIDWTSGNDDIDKFIQDTQLSAHYDVRGVLEWIPYDRFYDIKYISKDDFSEVYRANWIDGKIGTKYVWEYNNYSHWDDVNQNWIRNVFNMFVNLKSLNSPNDLTFELANKVVY